MDKDNNVLFYFQNNEELKLQKIYEVCVNDAKSLEYFGEKMQMYI